MELLSQTRHYRLKSGIFQEIISCNMLSVFAFPFGQRRALFFCK